MTNAAKTSKTENKNTETNEDLSHLLDGKRFNSIAEHIIALRVTGVYVEADSWQERSELVVSAQRELDANFSFEDNCIHIIKEVAGKRLLKDATELARLRGFSKREYIAELKEACEDFQYADEIRFIDDNNLRYGLIRKLEWDTEPLIDPFQLEFYFDKVFRNRFTAAEAAVFDKAFMYCKTPREVKLFGWDADLSTHDHYSAMSNRDFFGELFDQESKNGMAATNKFNELIMNSIYSPFSEHCSFEFSADDCYWSIRKNLFYIAIAGLRDNSQIDICIFDGTN